jgi:cardiolipin synthase
MDRRSLQLNFENNLLICDRETTATIRQRQSTYLAVSRQVNPEAVRGWTFRARLAHNAVGMMSPIL